MGLPANKKIYDALASEKKKPAIDYLKKQIAEHIKILIRADSNRDPESWFAPYHLGWGMVIRNGLRDAGFGEEYFRIGNLDDIYVELVEDAVLEEEAC